MEQFQQEKLDRFVNSVDGEVDAQISDMIQEAQQQGEEIKATAKDAALKAPEGSQGNRSPVQAYDRTG